MATPESTHTDGPPFARSTGYLPPSDVLVAETLQTMTHQVWINRQYICSTDRDYLADMVSRAINHWRKTPDGKRWWSERRKADNAELADRSERSAQRFVQMRPLKNHKRKTEKCQLDTPQN